MTTNPKKHLIFRFSTNSHFENSREFSTFDFFPKISKIILRHGKQYFLFNIFCSAYKKTPEMKELEPNKQTLKISTHNSEKQKS